MNELNPVPPVSEAASSVVALLRRAQAGDATAVPLLRPALHDPALMNIIGNLAQRIEDELLQQATANDLAFREALTLKLVAMRTELAGGNPTPLEWQLVDRIVLCWLHLHVAEYQLLCTSHIHGKYADQWQRRIDACHRRYLQAVKTLAMVRKLAVPVILAQVSISTNQATA